jgi:Xaa-Pro aminopeptidase
MNQTLSERLQQRRENLLDLIAQQHAGKQGTVFLFAPAEPDHAIFQQESSFFYFSGILEPSSVLTFAKNEPTTLYQPDFGPTRAKWIHAQQIVNDQTKKLFRFDEVKNTGKIEGAYSVGPYFSAQEYQYVIEILQRMVQEKQTIFTLYPQHTRAYASVKKVIDRLSHFVPGLMQQIVDVSDLVVKLRRKKDSLEIESLYQAIAVTRDAFHAAAYMLKPEVNEAQIQATMEYIFTEQGAQPAYPCIVATGKNATILHYHTNRSQAQKGDLMLIDAGAKFNHYCADITRVFPVSGKFSARQKELYEVVLATQEHVASLAKPGMWLSNAQEQEISLQHIAQKFLKDQGGYDQYFGHGIGHFLGLDVHDVGARESLLEAGDVITIEPGVYIPDEKIGIRIEDNYWILPESEPACLSEEIPKTVDDVEAMMS